LETPPRDQRWEDDEIALVHKHKDDLHPNNYLVFLMGLYTLQRIGDILDLDRDQYDGEKISLQQAKTLKKSRKLLGFLVHIVSCFVKTFVQIFFIYSWMLAIRAGTYCTLSSMTTMTTMITIYTIHFITFLCNGA